MRNLVLGYVTITVAFVLGAGISNCGFASAGDSEKNGAENVPLTESKAIIFRGSGEWKREGAIELGRGPHLFLDDYLIEGSNNVLRVVNSPLRDDAIPNPIVTGKEDGCFQPYMTIVREGENGRFRLWFGHRTGGNETGSSHIGYMESPDGIHWQRPARVLEDPSPIQFGASVVDDGAGAQDPAQRYKLAWWYGGGLRIATSADGLNWKPLSQDVVLYANHDITGIFRDTLRNRYVATISVYRTGGPWSGQRRVTMQAFSADLLKWDEPHYVLTPDDRHDDGETQFYAMDGYLIRGDLTIGMVKVLRDDLKADNPPDPPDAYGMGYTALAWTHDGETWYRDREHFFDPDSRKGAWDHAHAWIDEQFPVGEEVFLYYGGYARGHKVNRFEERQIGLLRMKQDRYVARVAGEAEGHILTPLVSLDADHIYVNADAKEGRVDARIIGEDGKMVEGFFQEDCSGFSGDSVSGEIKWKRGLRELARKPLRIEFILKNARLFAFELR